MVVVLGNMRGRMRGGAGRSNESRQSVTLSSWEAICEALGDDQFYWTTPRQTTEIPDTTRSRYHKERKNRSCGREKE